MTTPEAIRAFADKAVCSIAKAIREHDFAAYQAHFDPKLDDGFSPEDFAEAIEEEAEGLGFLESHTYLGQIRGNQGDHPGSIRFIYAGVFTHGEGVIILSVHERDGALHLHEHVHHW